MSVIYSQEINMTIIIHLFVQVLFYGIRGRCGHDRMVVGFITTYAITTEVTSSKPTKAGCTQYNMM